MTNDARQGVLDVLSCEIDVRPADAPGIDALAAAIQGVEREGDALLVSFAVEALETVRRFAAAERQCCASIHWEVEATPGIVRLRVGVEPEQIAVLEAMFRAARLD